MARLQIREFQVRKNSIHVRSVTLAPRVHTSVPCTEAYLVLVIRQGRTTSSLATEDCARAGSRQWLGERGQALAARWRSVEALCRQRRLAEPGEAADAAIPH